MAKQCIVCGKNTGIKDKDNFCPACGAKLPEVIKQGTYISERVVNISELESYIERAHLSICSLIIGIKDDKILSIAEVKENLEKIDAVLQRAYQFEFHVER